MKNYCSIRNEYTFTYENYSVTIPCQVMENGTDAIIDYGAGHIFDQVYYSEYNCEFWQCVKDSQTLFVLVSEKAMNYWKGKFAILLGLSFIVFASIFLISRSRATTLIVTGVLIVIAVLPFRKLNWALNLVPQKLSGIFSVFFTKAHSVFVIMLVIGIVLIAFGIVSKMFGWKMEFGKDSSEEEEPEEKNRSNSRYKKKYSK